MTSRKVTAHPSPNCGPRRDGLTPSLIVLHYTAMDGAAEALERLCDPEHEVSAHYLIARDGRVFQLVDEDQRAWHAGAGAWQGVDDINSRSIGIELDNDGLSPFSAPLMDSLDALLPGIMARHGIAPAGVIGHSDMAPDRKIDPGPRFDWQRLARLGLSVWPQPGAEPGDFARDARAFGYPDEDEGTLLTAFRHRFCPWSEGPLGDADRSLMADLARRFGVDRSTSSA